MSTENANPKLTKEEVLDLMPEKIANLVRINMITLSSAVDMARQQGIEIPDFVSEPNRPSHPEGDDFLKLNRSEQETICRRLFDQEMKDSSAIITNAICNVAIALGLGNAQVRDLLGDVLPSQKKTAEKVEEVLITDGANATILKNNHRAFADDLRYEIAVVLARAKDNNQRLSLEEITAEVNKTPRFARTQEWLIERALSQEMFRNQELVLAGFSLKHVGGRYFFK